MKLAQTLKKIYRGMFLFLLLLLALPEALYAAPTVNGLFYGDGDESQYVLYNTSVGNSKLWYTVAGNRLYVALVVNPALVNDNAFSDKKNSAYTIDAGYPNHRSAKRLTDSEFAEFTLTVGDVAITWQQGYADQSGGYNNTQPTWYSSETAGNGGGTPPPGYVSSSSFVWNLNNYANNPAPNWNMDQYGTDRDSWMSPFKASDPTKALGLDGYETLETAGFSSYYQWEWPMVYEWSADLSGFGTAPIFVISAMSHHSPPKTGEENDAFPPPPPSGNEYLSDYGDLPDAYETLLANNGAYHYIVPNGAFLGAFNDPEPDGLPDLLALGDDNSASDDEDGVELLSPLFPGSNAIIRVTAGTAGYLSAFVDWDGNEDLDDVELSTSVAVNDMALAAGVHDLTIKVPLTATGSMPARFRFTGSSGEGGGNSGGPATSGEVEDYIFTSALGDRVWIDTNGNGVQDGGEPGLSGVVVNLYRPSFGPDGIAGNGDDGNVVSSTTTATDGGYAFDNLYPGSYSVNIVEPAGFNFTTPNQGSSDSLDSDADISSGLTPTTVLVSGENDVSRDGGLYQPASLGDYVWMDPNGDGVQDLDESGIGGVCIYVDGNGNGNYDAGEPFNVTSADGSYLITELPPGTLKVRVDISTLPDGLIQTYDLDGSLDHSTEAALISGQDRIDLDFGYRLPDLYSISGEVRDDFDLDGTFSDPDSPAGGVLVQLYSDPNGDGNPSDGSVLASMNTLADGSYFFDDLIAGNYVVVENDPGSSESTADTGGANDNNIPVAIVNSNSTGNDFLDGIDPAGYFYDVADGRIVPGGTIEVTGLGAVIQMDGRSGQYAFISTNLTETTFTITVTPPPGYKIDPDRTAATGPFDPTGGPDPTVLGSYEDTNGAYLVNYRAESNPYYYVFDLALGDPLIINNNFPLVKLGSSITGSVFLDKDRLTDAIVNGEGTNAGSLHVSLVDPGTDLVIASQPVNEDGTYRFDSADGVLVNTDYTLILTTSLETEGSSLTQAVLPQDWISTGEHVGAGAGDDGTADSILAVATTLDGVTAANFGIDNVCDLAPVITVISAIMNNQEDFSIIVRINELKNVATTGLITVKVPKDLSNLWVRNGLYDPNMKTLEGIPLNNSAWVYSEDATDHIFTTKPGVVIGGMGFSTFGFDASWDSGVTIGSLPISVVIVPFSGNEDRINNNFDSEQVDYFIK